MIDWEHKLTDRIESQSKNDLKLNMEQNKKIIKLKEEMHQFSL